MQVYFIDYRNSCQVATHDVINKLAAVHNAILVIVFHIESNVRYIYLLTYYYHYLVIVIILNACVIIVVLVLIMWLLISYN